MTPTKTKGSWKLANTRMACAASLELFGLNPTEPGELATNAQSERIASMANMPRYYRIPDKLVSLAKSNALSRTEAARTINGAHDTFQMVDDPSEFHLPKRNLTFADIRKVYADVLRRCGIANINPGNGRGKNRLTTRQLNYIAALADNPDYDIDPNLLVAAMRGLLTIDEASRVISATEATYLHLQPFSLDL